MRHRCNPNFWGKKYYHDKGIKVCKRWNSFDLFLSDMGERPPGTSIDRIKNDGDYKPSNCRWATRYQQTRNTSRNIFIKFNNKRMCLEDWGSELKMSADTIYARYVAGWPLENVLSVRNFRFKRLKRVLSKSKKLDK